MKEIIELALENLQKNTPFKGVWKNSVNVGQDGNIKLTIDNKQFTLNIEVKRELRMGQMPEIVKRATQFKPLIVIAERIFPKIKDELRKEQIAYLEGNGNIFLHQDGIYLWIDNNKPIEPGKEKNNRAFTKTGLKVIFHFLLDEGIINLPYREIAERTGTGLGNITNVINGLKEDGYLLTVRKNEYKITRKKELFNKWVTTYEERLKPTLEVGTFSFIKKEDFANWKNIHLKNQKTYWGGEPAGDMLTGYLNPGMLTLYTEETKKDLIKNYRLMPDAEGNVKVYKKFWKYDEVNYDLVPPLLVYADLMNEDDRRCTETAQKIYNDLIQNKL